MKRLKIIYNKILFQIENEDIKIIVKESLAVVKNIFICMILILLGFIFIPTVKWGWLDRDVMISSISTLIGGFFGLIAGIVGIVGTYGAFYLGSKEQKEKEEDEKRDKENFELQVLQKLLEHTLEETSIMSSVMINKFIDFHKNKGIMDKLYTRYITHGIVFERMIEELLTDGLYEDVKIMSSVESENLYFDIQDVFNRNYNAKSLVYTDEWHKYMLHLRKHKKYTDVCIKDIINWITLLNDNSIENHNKMISELNKEKLSLESKFDYSGGWTNTSSIEKEIEDIKKKQLDKIMEFIKYRDNVIDVLNLLFDNHETEYDILASYKELEKEIIYYRQREK